MAMPSAVSPGSSLINTHGQSHHYSAQALLIDYGFRDSNLAEMFSQSASYTYETTSGFSYSVATRLRAGGDVSPIQVANYFGGAYKGTL